jgi:peroxin-1
LKLHDFRDAVQLKPYVPRVVGPDNVKFARVRLSHNVHKKAPACWSIPEIALSSGQISLFNPRPSSSSTKTNVSVPAGSLIPFSSGEPFKDRGENWVRVTIENGENALKRSVGNFDLTKLHQALDDVDDPGDTTVQVDARAYIRGPKEYVGSSKWPVPALGKMKKFVSVVVKIYGATGSGKSHNATLLASLASHDLHRPVLYLNCKKLQKSSPKMAGILGELDALFKQAQDLHEAIVVLDDLDCLSPNLLDNGESNSSAKMQSTNPAAVDQSKVIADRILHSFETLSARRGVSLITTCANLDSINSDLFRSLKVPLIPMKIPVLSSDEQMELLQHFLNQQSLSCSIVGTESNNLPQRLSGFLPRDLEKLSLRAGRIYQTSHTGKSIEEILLDVLDEFTPLAQMRASNRNRTVRALGWEDIGGLVDVKEKLDAVVRHPILYQRIYEKARIRLPRGILLYGPPGCGKSCIVPALAQVCNYPIVKVRGPEIFDKYIGASEAKVREMFERATQMAPSILFFDELEALAPRRGSDSTGVTDRVVNQLLTFLDGVEDASTATVYIVGATSRPDKVDPAVIRPGRLERHLYLGPPEEAHEWTDLLQRISKQWNLTTNCSTALSNGTLFPLIQEKPRLSPADVRAAFDTAHLHAVHRHLANSRPSEIELIEIDTEDLLAGFQDTRPSLNESEAQSLDLVYKPFRAKLSGYNKEESKGDVASQLRTTFR